MLAKLFLPALVFLLIFSSCGEIARPEDAESASEQDVPMSFNFISSSAPFKENSGNALLRAINKSSLEIAKAEGRDSAYLLATKDSAGHIQTPELPEDVKFFPVLSKQDLLVADSIAQSYNSKDDADSINSIDFNRYFALIVTHPPLFEQGFYTDHVVTNYTSDSTLILQLSYDFIQTKTPISSAVWNTSVFTMPKGHYKKIGVALNADTTYFSLKTITDTIK